MKFLKNYLECFKYSKQNILNEELYKEIGKGFLNFIYLITLPFHPIILFPIIAIKKTINKKHTYACILEFYCPSCRSFDSIFDNFVSNNILENKIECLYCNEIFYLDKESKVYTKEELKNILIKT